MGVNKTTAQIPTQAPTPTTEPNMPDRITNAKSHWKFVKIKVRNLSLKLESWIAINFPLFYKFIPTSVWQLWGHG